MAFDAGSGITRVLHKYLGLTLALYLMAMGISGLLLNNPDQISGLSVPWRLTPANYEPRNWNRMYLRQGIISGEHWFFAGKPGVVYSNDGGRSFSLLAEGFAGASYQRDTTSLLLLESHASGHELFAATRSGLYHCRMGEAWQRIQLPDPDKPVVDVIRTPGQIVAINHQEIFAAPVSNDANGEETVSANSGSAFDPDGKQNPAPADYRFKKVNPEVLDGNRPSVPWFRIFHDMHNGGIIGSTGKWLLDLLAVSLIFLCFSALILWYVPWRNRRIKRRNRLLKRMFVFCWRYHLKIGIYTVAFLSILAVTGALLRPPLLIAIASHSLDRDHPFLALSPRSNEWGGKIQKALYSSASDSIWLATEGGFFMGPADFNAPFRPQRMPIPIHGMGVTVLEEMKPGLILVGSFMGLYIWEENSGAVRRLPRPGLRGGNPYMSNDLVSGVVMADGRPVFRVDYHDGLMPLFHQTGEYKPEMPAEIVRDTPISLWHYLFEFHNGRIFEKWLGPWYMLIIPVIGASVLLLCITGLYDWLLRRKKRARR